jgi:hypothetical protein
MTKLYGVGFAVAVSVVCLIACGSAPGEPGSVEKGDVPGAPAHLQEFVAPIETGDSCGGPNSGCGADGDCCSGNCDYTGHCYFCPKGSTCT